MQALRTVGWAACCVYGTIPLFWLVIHPRVEYWRARQRSPYRVLMPLWMGMWVVAGAITYPWRHLLFYATPLTWIPAIALFACGLQLYRHSGRGFTGAQLGGRHELEPHRFEQRLVTTGIRSRVRHPVYLAHFCEMLAWSVGTGLAVVYALTGFALLTGALMTYLEERELEQRFGEEYRSYRQRVPAFLPRLFARQF
ncbi:MAG TPA: isoprenylcysteine carboxylmethyltransferase family protein [Terriglobales bacterium]|nr:isoprenylcysteine carboxylmethyltransferase family protein [Terriglobales bacterium]